MNSPDSPRPKLLPRWSGTLVRILAVLLFLFIGWLTIPKIKYRWNRLFTQRDARVEIAREKAGASPLASEEVVRPADVLLIVAVIACGGAVLLSLGYCVLKSRATSRQPDQAAQPPTESHP